MAIRVVEFFELENDPRFEIVWAEGLPLSKSRQEAYFYKATSGFVCTVKHEGFEVDIYCDGEMKVKNTKTEEVYRYGDDLLFRDYDDAKLIEAFDKEELISDMNPWFDMYAYGDHLDNVHHTISEALESAGLFLEEEAQNARAIENFGISVDESDTPSIAV